MWGRLRMQIPPKVWGMGMAGGSPLLFLAPTCQVWSLLDMVTGSKCRWCLSWSIQKSHWKPSGWENSVSVDLSELGGGTLPPCGWRMKLNVMGESKITNSSFSRSRGEGDAVCRQKHTEKKRVEKRVTRKWNGLGKMRDWKLKIQRRWIYDKTEDGTDVEKKNTCFTVKTC